MVSLAAYRAARENAGIVAGHPRGFIAVTGADRTAFLHGLLTNDIAALRPGGGCYAAYLTPQGRMITDLWVYNDGDELLVALSRESTAALTARLDALVFTEDVQLTDRSESLDSVAVIGPSAASIVASALEGVTEQALAALPPHGNTRTIRSGQPVVVMRVDYNGLPGFEALGPHDAIGGFRKSVGELGVPSLDDETVETLRIEGGVPKFHQDMTEETIPLEAGLEANAISFTKGCYVGQEVIVRVMHRGHGRVARRLVGVIFDGGDIVKPRTPLDVDGRQVGSVTSGVYSPALKRAIALGYVQRELAEAGTRVTADGAGGVVTALPFERQDN